MGNLQSTFTKQETRRSKRLSKPPDRRVAALSSPVLPPPEFDQSELNSGLIGWQNPWVGSRITQDIRTSYTRTKEIPPTVFEVESTSPQQSGETSNKYINGLNIDLSDTISAASSGRRASYQFGSVSGSSQASWTTGQLRRANSISVQSPLQSDRSVICENTINDAAFSNTHFMVGNQRFSLTRRRSLLTRPGVATRRTTGAIRRVPSPIGEPEALADDSLESTVLHWPLPPPQRASLPVVPPARPSSPADSRYTQLGALKLGSLRVVNGSASPCPSERIPLGRPPSTEPKVGSGAVKITRPRGSTLEIPLVVDVKNSDDVPGSPFSFDKSPVITIPPRSKSMFLRRESEDEGIGLCDDGITQVKSTTETDGDRSTSRSLNKSDSGYSSATSVRSTHRSRTRASFDSQVSAHCAVDSERSMWAPFPSDQLGGRPLEKVQRHLSLHETRPGNYSQLNPSAVRWYDPPGPTKQHPGLRTRRSTLCAPRYTEYPVHADAVSESATMDDSYLSPRPPKRSVTSHGSLYVGDNSFDSVDTVNSANSSITLETSTASRSSSDTDICIRRSASEHQFHRKDTGTAAHSRSRSRYGSRVWSQKPGIGVPPLPTILSPDHPPTGEEMENAFPLPEPSRGRPRSRSQDHRRRRLTKARPQSNVHMIASACALY